MRYTSGPPSPTTATPTTPHRGHPVLSAAPRRPPGTPLTPPCPCSAPPTTPCSTSNTKFTPRIFPANQEGSLENSQPIIGPLENSQPITGSLEYEQPVRHLLECNQPMRDAEDSPPMESYPGTSIANQKRPVQHRANRGCISIISDQ
ncbi:hypothetical protein O3P69_019182 [Scylla paramamosain]|uniref:Uncharacterized protein n=1 Tax=Scylla paramamosain TaxID=85552 RepID=A0AAW0SUP8_SCYPA